MELFVTIIEQRPLQSRPYTDSQGQNRVFYSKGFVLSNGIDEFYAEMTGDGCIGCSSCAVVCPDSVITVYRVKI